MAATKKGMNSIWDPEQPGLVSQDFLDMLNGESAKVSAALQNPGNWPGIMAAAQEAPERIRELEREMGLKAPAGTIGPGGPITEEEFERIQTAKPGAVVQVSSEATAALRSGHEQSVALIEHQAFDGWRPLSSEETHQILANANKPHTSIEYPETMRRRFIRAGRRLLESIRGK